MPGCSFGPTPPVQEVAVSVRPSSDNDPGEIAVAYFIVQDGCVVLTDAAGTPLKDAKPELFGRRRQSKEHRRQDDPSPTE